MNSHDVIRHTLGASQYLLSTYLSDFSDSDMLACPAAGCNSVAWQVGHLIASEHKFINALRAGSAPELPVGFGELHSNKNIEDNNHSGKFLPKQRYLELAAAQRRSTLELLETVTEQDFDKPAPEWMLKYAPTVGVAFNTIGTHWLMHIGQIVVVRRVLGKAVLI